MNPHRLTILVISLFVCLLPSTSLAEDILSMKARISVIGIRIGRAAGVEPKILVTNEKKPEAYVYPDKTIIITRGLMELVDSDDEAAFVIGHEIAHTVKSDCKEETILGILNGNTIPKWKKNEIQADIAGINFAIKAGYNPLYAEKLLTKMYNHHGMNGKDFIERIDAISIYITGLSFDGNGN